MELKKIIKEVFDGIFFSREEVVTDGEPCIRYADIYTTYNICCEQTVSCVKLNSQRKYKYCSYGDLLIASVSNSFKNIAKPLAYLGKTSAVIDNGITVLRHSQNPKYLAYALSTDSVKKQKYRLCNLCKNIINTSYGQLLQFQIPLPSLDKQEKIANWLDRFRELTENISKGLPKEILLLKQQSRYYREKLIN